MILNDTVRTAEFVLEENAYRSRETISVSTGKLAAGTILTKIADSGTRTLSATAKVGNTGNGVFTADPSAPVSINAQQGTYIARCIAATTNAATFRLFDPNSGVLGDANYSGSGSSASFNDQIKFTITDGSTDFAIGDEFDITVNIGSANTVGSYAATVAGGNADAVLVAPVDASAGAVTAPAIVRSAELLGDMLTFPASASDQVKRNVVASLGRSGIRVRWTNAPTA